MGTQRLDEVPGVQALVPTEKPNIILRTFVLLAEPTREFRARDALKDMFDIKSYVPQEDYTSMRTIHTMFGVQRRRVQSVRPIFRGYVFADLNMAWSFGLDQVPGLRQNGRQYLIHNGAPVIVRPHDVELLRRAEYTIANPGKPILPYKVGDQVRITDEGRFVDQVARVLAIDSARRIELLLGGLGRIFVESWQIVPAELNS